MQSILDYLNLGNDIYGIVRTFVALAGFFALLVKVREYFTDFRDKQSLKADLEILQLLDSSSSVYQRVNEAIESKAKRTYDPTKSSSKILNFFIGLITFIGFGLWSVNLFQEKDGFSPWMILTLIICAVGLSMILSPQDNSKEKSEFLRISFYGRSDMNAGLMIGFVSMFSIVLMLISDATYLWGYFVAGLFTIIGFSTLIRQIKLKRISIEK